MLLTWYPFHNCIIVCPVTGVMTFLEVQMGKDYMKDTEHFEELGATASCSLRASTAVTQRKEDEAPVELVLGDSWFGSVKAAVAQAKAGFECIFQIKTNHSLFPKKQIEEILCDAPGGISVVLQGNVDGIPLLCIGYKYNKKTTLHFVCTSGAGSTGPGEPYEMKWSDDHGNIHIRNVSRPAVISRFFKHSNSVDVHNHLRQYCLKLEKKWVTVDCWFRLTTTLMGISAVDAFRLAKFHNFLPCGRINNVVKNDIEDDGTNELSMKRFSGILANQLLYKAYNLNSNFVNLGYEDFLTEPLNPNGKSGDNCKDVLVRENAFGRSTNTSTKKLSSSIPSFVGGKMNTNSQFIVGDNRRDVNCNVYQDASSMSMKSNIFTVGSENQKVITIHDSDTEADQTDSLQTDSDDLDYTFERLRRARRNALCIMTDVRAFKHSVVKLPSTTSNGKSTKGKKYVRPRKCYTCGTLSRVKCLECDKVFCYPIKNNKSNVSDSCFCLHVNEITKKRRKKRKVCKKA